MKRNEPNFKQFTKLNQQNLSFVQIHSLSGVVLKYANGAKSCISYEAEPILQPGILEQSQPTFTKSLLKHKICDLIQ